MLIRLYWHFEDVTSYPMKLSKSKKFFTRPEKLGPERARTADLLLAKQALYQLSYRPEAEIKMVGQRGIAPLTPALSALCSTN